MPLTRHFLFSSHTITMHEATDNALFQCLVCFEERLGIDTVTLEACGHVCCRECLRTHVTTKISSGQRRPTCFHMLSFTGRSVTVCPAIVSEAEIEHLVDSKTLALYRRLTFNAHHPVYGRQCPSCDHSQVFPQGEEEPQCTCSACGNTFCFAHGNAHVGRTCGEYKARRRTDEQGTIAIINRTTKRCPGCAITIEKDGGCNHMICLHCGTSFCWLCLAQVEQTSYPVHFQTFSFSACAGLQHTDEGQVVSLDRMSRWTFRGLVGIVVGVPAVVVTVALTVVTIGWYPIRMTYGGTLWGATKVCFYFTALSMFNTLVQARDTIVERWHRTWRGITDNA